MAINIKDYTYTLPTARIALFPLEKREQSKLLVSIKGKISHQQFADLPVLLPANTHLYFNNTKVIPARLHFQKETGASIEIFLLNPVEPSSLMIMAMESKNWCTWRCTIGNLKKWNDGLILNRVVDSQLTIKAELLSRSENLVKLSWEANLTFAEVVEKIGETPLPPYLNREAEKSDKERYQTVYSKLEGAVAAPTAGLHFTSEILDEIQALGIKSDFLTLHVSAGTFQPVKAQDATQHIMHNEQIIITRKNLQSLLQTDQFVLPVGTTSMRTLESLYWFGCKLLKDPNAAFEICQDEPQQHGTDLPSREHALQAVMKSMDENQVDQLAGRTSIFILPGYVFKMCNGLITNFHQPGSTLMLLVAAFIGDSWKEVYKQALENNYRFLSYGDSSLLIP
jgi:S-adenosylmethionine:tRNA ribosyltransferase-isomerase